ncbi:glycine--tRNA ligase [bacterium]|nr:glycine--tRNA ligase [bacterium]
MKVTMEKLQALARSRGFVYPDSEIYGGMANTWDYGPLGVELKNNFKKLWWKHFVQERPDMVGVDTALIMNPKVWEASGHVGGFTDVLADCTKCKLRFRADHLIEDALKIDVEGKSNEDISKLLKDSNIKCPNCKAVRWTDARSFNLLFKTHVGVTEDDKSIAYLRGETAQGMFTDFKHVLSTSRKRLPLGIAQVGKAFRNEITPGNYIFRTREFEIAEFEYFIPQNIWEEKFEFWLGKMKEFAAIIGIKEKDLHVHEIPEEKRAHYSKRTVDLEFDFPFGQKELWGLAYRTDFDLLNHEKSSGEDLKYTDPTTNEKYLPHVIEPTFGVDRSLLAILLSAYMEERVEGKDELRVVLKLPKELAPYKVAILPLSKDEKLSPRAMEVFDILAKKYSTEYDETQSIGKRYRRQDEIGTPYCVTVDFDTLEDKAVTVRDRDSMKQERIAINKLESYLDEKFK